MARKVQAPCSCEDQVPCLDEVGFRGGVSPPFDVPLQVVTLWVATDAAISNNGCEGCDLQVDIHIQQSLSSGAADGRDDSDIGLLSIESISIASILENRETNDCKIACPEIEILCSIFNIIPALLRRS